MLSLLISMISYVLFVLFAGGSAVRDASGNVTDLIDGSALNVIPDCLVNNNVSLNCSIPFNMKSYKFKIFSRANMDYIIRTLSCN